MKKLLFAAALLALPTLVYAAPGNGVDLSWSDCVTGSPTNTRTFVCTGTANANHNLVVQYLSSTPITNAAAWTATIDYINDTGDLGTPATGFWREESDNPCGSATDPLGIVVSGLPNCEANVSDDGSATGVAGVAWTSNMNTRDQVAPGRAKIIAAYARGLGILSDAGVHYYAFHLLFRTGHRALCTDGCSDPGAFVLNDVFVDSFDAGQGQHLSGTDKFGDCVTVNGGNAAGDCLATAVQNSTWGKLKAMYR